MIQPWPKLSSQARGKFAVFSIREDRKVSPRTGREHDFVVLDCTNWVNVVAVTPDQQLVMVEQFRHGSESVELEIPGGVMDPDETDPVETAVRELREETGYEGRHARLLASIRPNPAIMSNTCHIVLLEHCRLVHPVDFDHGEDILTRLLPADEAISQVALGRIQHALVLVGLFYFDLWRRGLLMR
jgi:8-oxo-dGTP pyrophosphatase MutT (NUDIX family)